METKLYPWQERCLESWLANHGRGIVQAATGSGKTLLALAAADKLEKELEQDLRVKIVVPTAALMRQWQRALSGYLAGRGCGDDARIRRLIGLRGGGFHTDADRKYMIYVINSARYELARQILSELQNGERVLMIADECHRYESGQNSLIFEFLPHIKEFETHYFSLGLTATLPSGSARDYLTSVLGEKIYTYGMKQASASDQVCTYDIFHIGLSFQPWESEEYQDITERMKAVYGRLLKARPFLKSLDQKEKYKYLRELSRDKDRRLAESALLYINLSYKRRGLVCMAAERTACVCDLTERLPSGEKILIFGERIRQAEELYALLEKRYPGRVGRYHSRMRPQANKNTMERFRDGDVRILIACKALDEGIDIADVSVGIVLSGTSVQRQRVQRLGRIVRKNEGKERAALYYLHITESAEDNCFLPDVGECRMLELAYTSARHEFASPRYQRASSLLLDEMRRRGGDDEVLAEVCRCLSLGSVRADWMSEQAEISAKIREAENTRDKNYWVCMGKIAKKI